MATVLTPQQLAAKRQELFQQQEQATIRASQQSAMAQRAQLQQSLSAARQDYESARLQAQEGFYQQNRDILKATSMRGLADSGQANIAEAQSQAAYGETISGLYGQKQAVEQQAVTQTQMIEQSVAAATTEANIQRATQQLQSDQQLFNEVQAIEDNKKAQVASLVELAMSGEYTPKQLQQLSDAYGISGEELTTVMNASSYFDPTGDLKMQETWSWDEIGKYTTIGAGTGATVGAISGNPLLAGAAGLIGGALGFVFGVGGEIGKQLANEVRGVYRISPGQGYEDITGTKAEVIRQIRQRYQNFEGSSEILVDLQKGLTGIGSDKIVFVYEGKSYNTYNEALKALRARA